MNPPFSKAVMDVPEELAERYAEQGWSEVATPTKGGDGEAETPRRSARRARKN